jgi:hypothetical protein
VRVHHKSFYVYRCWADDELLYVGISSNLLGRLGSHSASQPWWPDVTDVEWDVFDSFADASYVEHLQIVTYRPSRNRVGVTQPYYPATYQPRVSSRELNLKVRRALEAPPPRQSVRKPLAPDAVVRALIERWTSEDSSPT